LHFDADNLLLFTFVLISSKNTSILCKICTGHSRSSKIVDFGINRKRACNYQLSSFWHLSFDWIW